MKKIEASLIKRFLRISWQDFFSAFGQFSFGALSLFSLSHTLGHLRFFLEHFNIISRKAKKGKGKQTSSKEE